MPVSPVLGLVNNLLHVYYRCFSNCYFYAVSHVGYSECCLLKQGTLFPITLQLSRIKTTDFLKIRHYGDSYSQCECPVSRVTGMGSSSLASPCLCVPPICGTSCQRFGSQSCLYLSHPFLCGLFSISFRRSILTIFGSFSELIA